MFNKSQFGRSMIEMLSVLVIIGVLSVGGLAGYSKAMRTIKVNEAVEYINHLRVERKMREVTGAWTSGSYSTCVNWLGGTLPTGITGCDIRGGNGRIVAWFSSGDLLKEVAQKFKVVNWNHCSDESVDSGTAGFTCYYKASDAAWINEYWCS